MITRMYINLEDFNGKKTSDIFNFLNENNFSIDPIPNFPNDGIVINYVLQSQKEDILIATGFVVQEKQTYQDPTHNKLCGYTLDARNNMGISFCQEHPHCLSDERFKNTIINLSDILASNNIEIDMDLYGIVKEKNWFSQKQMRLQDKEKYTELYRCIELVSDIPFQAGKDYSKILQSMLIQIPLPEATILEAHNNHCLNSYHNILISGTPGIGKSYLVENYIVPEIIAKNKAYKEFKTQKDALYTDDEKAKEIEKATREQFTERITFTSSTSYEDFFGCYKPKKSKDKDGKTIITYEFTPGVFSQILKKSVLNPQNNYVLIIEEINRADVYDVFGQIFQLLDRTDRQDSEYGISIAEDAKEYFSSEKDETQSDNKSTIFMDGFNSDKMHIPSNLFIIGTLNSADQGVRMLDTAFKRRFSMVYVNVRKEIFCSSKIPISETVTDAGFELIISKNKKNIISKEDYVKEYLKPINNILLNGSFAEDKMIAEKFIKVGDDGIEEVELLINIFGYLLQNVYRNRQLSTEIFVNKEHFTLFLLLSEYVKHRTKTIVDGKTEYIYQIDKVINKKGLEANKVRKKANNQ